MTHQLDTLRLPELQKYLRARGVTVTGYNKVTLKEIALAVEKLNLPIDPDYVNDSVLIDIKKKLKKAGLPDTNPLELDGYTSDFTYIPEFGLIDVFNYMIFNKSEYDGKKLKGYKSFEDYRLFYDGHVESLFYNPVSDRSDVCIFKAKVKPTQRDKTYLNKDFYDLWFALDKEDGSIITGHCECIGGADGACRHLAAALYELDAFDMKSCTEGENQWMKRPRQHDTPLPVRHLTVIKARYGAVANQAPKPHSDLYDPRTQEQRHTLNENEKRVFGLKLQEISGNTQALDILLNPEDFSQEDQGKVEDPRQFSIMKKAEQFKKNLEGNIDLKKICEQFYELIKYSPSEIDYIMEKTEGQASNKFWFEMRKGLLTASNFHQACKYIDDQRDPSITFMKSVLGKNSLDEQSLPGPIKWGRQKEPVAREMYARLLRHQHRNLKIKEKGLLLSKEFPMLGCSVDGICTCTCKPDHRPKVIEIKCPFSQRFSNPIEAAVNANCVKDKATGLWVVTPSCPYYAQIQGQLGLYGYEDASLVIFTKFGIHVSNVKFDQLYFDEMVKKLVLFHKKYILPRILNQQI